MGLNDQPVSGTDEYYDLGSFQWPITTNNQDTQIWFNRGITWCYGFNHQEAVKCFERAISHDRTCAIAHWGLSYAAGPNYNKPWQIFDKADLLESLRKTHQAAKDARHNISSASPIERALIEAVQSRYPDDKPQTSYSARNKAYANAMAKVYKSFSTNLDVAALYTDSLMSLTAWALWDLRTGQPEKGAHTLEAKAVLERAFTLPASDSHPGLIHYYIHLMEMSHTPEVALRHADRLRRLIPDAGHLNHMPSHIDIQVGDYRAAIAANLEAVRADEKYLKNEGKDTFYSIYRSHDYHMLIYSAMFAGQYKTAMQALQGLEAAVTEELMRVESPPMADWLEVFHSVRPHVLVRFGRWKDLINLPLPKDKVLYCMTTATIHYAKGIAFAATGDVKAAERQQQLFSHAAKKVPPTRLDFPNKCSDVLEVAEAMLDSELEYRRGNFDLAFQKFQHTLELDDGLGYSEPWSWNQPVRHAFGALLLEQGHVKKAAQMYREDLGLDKSIIRARWHPNNVWALQGYFECLQRMGEGASAEGRIIEQQLELAKAVADVDIKASCFCRMDAVSDVSCSKL